MPHTIRLRGPWQAEPLARTVLSASGASEEEPDDPPEPRRVKIPSDWSDAFGADFRGRVRYTRHFNRPTGLHAATRLELVVEAVDWRAEVSLNDAALGRVHLAECPARFDITEHLRSRNKLTLDIELPRLTPESPPLDRAGREDQPGGLIGLVWLEIFES